jgi:hypothetical protein
MSLVIPDSKRRITFPEIKQRINEVQDRVILDNLSSAIDTAIDNVAKEFGTMRKAIKTDLTAQFLAQRGEPVKTIILAKDRIVALDPKAEYHWLVGPTGLSFYKDPTTNNTKPIQPTEIMEELGNILQPLIVTGLRQERLIK